MTQHKTGVGSQGERELQRRLHTEPMASRFYDSQVLDHLNDRMREFVARQEMLFMATADAKGECDSTFRAGPPGFVQVLDDRTLAIPEYRGNGVMASLGNITENPHVGLLMVDFLRDLVGLHVNGVAGIVEDAVLRRGRPLPEPDIQGRRASLWVLVTVAEAYIHCAKHIPRLAKLPRARLWGTDDATRKKSDYFGSAGSAGSADCAGQ